MVGHCHSCDREVLSQINSKNQSSEQNYMTRNRQLQADYSPLHIRLFCLRKFSLLHAGLSCLSCHSKFSEATFSFRQVLHCGAVQSSTTIAKHNTYQTRSHSSQMHILLTHRPIHTHTHILNKRYCTSIKWQKSLGNI